MKLVVMPCFCMISGHLSPATIEDRHARGLVKVLATYLIFQGLYFAMKVVAFTLAGFGVQKLPIELFNPPQQVVTWFLLALIIWRASLPTMLRTRVPLLISLLLAHGALFADLGVNHHNVLSFWPFFVGGALVPRDAWAQLNRPDVRRPLAASFVTCALSLALFSAYAEQHFQRSPRRPTPACMCSPRRPYFSTGTGDSTSTTHSISSRARTRASMAHRRTRRASSCPSAPQCASSAGAPPSTSHPCR